MNYYIYIYTCTYQTGNKYFSRFLASTHTRGLCGSRGLVVVITARPSVRRHHHKLISHNISHDIILNNIQPIGRTLLLRQTLPEILCTYIIIYYILYYYYSLTPPRLFDIPRRFPAHPHDATCRRIVSSAGDIARIGT